MTETAKARIALVAGDAGRVDARSHWPHYGLVLLATELTRNGYEAKVFDQSYLRASDDEMIDALQGFAPDLLGVSLFTPYVERTLKFTERALAALENCRAIAGGPHVSLYADSMAGDSPFAALVRGEAEATLVDVVQRVLRGETPGIVESTPPRGEDILSADWTVALGYERMRWLPIQLSRGCPFNCSFCEVHEIAGRKIRYRSVAACLEEITQNLSILPHAHTVRIVDDCPTLDRDRFKRFLSDYMHQGLTACVSVDNMRADTIDEELVDLLKACRTPYICIGVESGNPDTFKMLGKGETLEDVQAAARLIKRKRIPLYLCFVVGLPGSSFEAEMDSLRLAERAKAQIIYWNMYVPHRGTRAREWFLEHGTVFDECNVNSLPDYNLKFTLPATETPEFPREERVRAWLKCVLETASFLMTPRILVRAFVLANRYRLWSSIPAMLAALPRKVLAYMGVYVGRFKARCHRRT